MATTTIKKIAKVAIVYSENHRYSNDSKNLAYYLCGLLSTSGYAQIHMIPFDAEGPVVDLAQRRISYHAPRSNKLIEVPVRGLSYLISLLIHDCLGIRCEFFVSHGCHRVSLSCRDR